MKDKGINQFLTPTHFSVHVFWHTHCFLIMNRIIKMLASTAQELLDLMVDSEELVSIVDLNFVRDSLKRRQQNGAIDYF